MMGIVVATYDINGAWYLLNQDGSQMEFNTKTQAVGFLRTHGMSDDEIEDLVLEDKEKPAADTAGQED